MGPQNEIRFLFLKHTTNMMLIFLEFSASLMLFTVQQDLTCQGRLRQSQE